MSELMWAAGLFEGEGSICLKKGDLPGLSLGSTDNDVLNRFADAVGTGRINGPYKSSGCKTPDDRKMIWHWQANGIGPVFRVLNAFYPYLGERRRKRAAQVIAEYYLSPVKRVPSRRNSAAVSI